MLDRIGLPLFWAVITGAPLSAIIGFAMWMDSLVCHARADAMAKAVKWGPISGCMIEARPGQWLPLDNYRVID